MTMMTCRVHGSASVQTAFCGMVTWNVREPVGTLSAMTGWVGDQTGLLMIVGVHVVVIGGSLSVMTVCEALGPCTRATRNQPVCAMVTVTVIETVAPGLIPPLTTWVGTAAPVGSSPATPIASHGAIFCGDPSESYSE
jgi:hypothetical protein